MCDGSECGLLDVALTYTEECLRKASNKEWTLLRNQLHNRVFIQNSTAHFLAKENIDITVGVQQELIQIPNPRDITRPDFTFLEYVNGLHWETSTNYVLCVNQPPTTPEEADQPSAGLSQLVGECYPEQDPHHLLPPFPPPPPPPPLDTSSVVDEPMASPSTACQITRVKLVGLKIHTDLNYKTGVLHGPDPHQEGRWVVCLDHNKELVSPRALNIELIV